MTSIACGASAWLDRKWCGFDPRTGTRMICKYIPSLGVLLLVVSDTHDTWYYVKDNMGKTWGCAEMTADMEEK